jgi:hypothetical protein
MAESGRCRKRCPCGGQCYCSADVPHELHICSASTCECHSAARYTGRLAVLDVGDVDPLGLGWRAATVLQREGAGV